MTTLGSQAKVKWDRRPDRLNRKATERDFRQIFHLAAELWDTWADAVDGGVWAPRTENGGRGSGFHDVNPTESAVLSPTRRQLRDAAKQASEAIADARAYLEMAADILHRAQLRQDPEVLAHHLEIRQAATQKR
jgi:hypothetical protein